MSSFDFGPAPRPKITPDRRREQRHRALKRALVTFNRGLSTVECTLHNMSRTGAKLSFEEPKGVPAVFDLGVAGDVQKHTARVRWRGGPMIGVELLD
jgi:hypothetical protein